ncbi:MAG: hypothetical protein ONB23_08165 [candidate division KSB1 bacterium]|nr:hypothetical protein [candidate division KSB1 bacterium]
MRFESFSLGVPVLILLLAAVAAVGLMVWHYRDTNPPVRRLLRVSLTTLRGGAVFLLLLALGDPVIEWVRFERLTPLLAVFLDASKSMGVVDESGCRGEAMRTWWGEARSRVASRARVVEYVFGARVRPLHSQDSLHFEDGGTDLSSVFRFVTDSLRDKPLAAILVLTDGKHTLGPEPLRYVTAVERPVFSVVFGDTARSPDLALLEPGVPEVAYVGKPFPVRVGISKAGNTSYRGSVKVRDDSTLLTQSPVHLEEGEGEEWLTVNVLPRKPGIIPFQLELDPLAGERGLENNRTSFYVRVLPSQKRILLAAGEPSADFSFLKRTLASDSNIVLAAACYLGGRWWVEDPKGLLRAGFDLAVLFDLPCSAVRGDATWLALKAAASKARKCVVFAGLRFDPGEAAHLFPAERLRFVRKEPSETVSCIPPPGGTHHPLCRMADFPEESGKIWRSLPPVLASGWAPEEGMLPILLGVTEAGESLVVAWSGASGEQEVALFALVGFWRWGFSPLAFGQGTEAFRRFVRNLAEWPHVGTATRLFRLEVRDIYEGGRPVRFRAFVQDEAGRPVEEARVTMEVQGGPRYEQLQLVPVADGVYEGELPALPEGRYQYRGYASKNGHELGSSEGQFAVKEYTPELVDPRASLALVAAAARATGGVAVLREQAQLVLDSLDALLGSEEWRRATRERRGNWTIHGSWWLVGLAGALLVLEWTLRRRNGLL